MRNNDSSKKGQLGVVGESQGAQKNYVVWGEKTIGVKKMIDYATGILRRH